MIKLTRRAVMMAAAASGLPSLSWAENLPAIHVVEGSGCECCKQWTNWHASDDPSPVPAGERLPGNE